MTAMTVIDLSPSTKVEAADFAQKLILQVESGEVNPLHLAIKMNAITKSLEVVKKAINDSVLKEAYTYSVKTFDAYGAEVGISELGVKYNYDNCNDPVLAELKHKQSELDAQIEERQKFLKAITKPMDIVVNECEAVKVFPPTKSSTTGIKITLK